MNKSGIYAITHTQSGRRYIGSAINFRSRWNSHKSRLKKSNHHSIHLQRAWNKYGADSFKFEILEECPPEQLLEREQWYLDNHKPPYNVCLTAGSPLGYKHSLETRIRMSKALKGRKPWNTGKTLPDELKQQISQTLTGRERPLEVCQKIAASKQGKKREPFSDEWRKNLGDARRGQKRSEETRRKIGEANRRRKLSDETKRKIGEANRRIRAEKKAKYSEPP